MTFDYALNKIFLNNASIPFGVIQKERDFKLLNFENGKTNYIFLGKDLIKISWPKYFNDKHFILIHLMNQKYKEVNYKKTY